MIASAVRVLHIEDDAAVRTSIGALLHSAGIETRSAPDAERAIAFVREGFRPDVLIVDFNLPGELDGSDVAEEICHWVGHPIPIILLSGELTNAAVPWVPGAPLFCVWKPVDPEVLLEVVGSFATLGRSICAHEARLAALEP